MLALLAAALLAQASSTTPPASPRPTASPNAVVSVAPEFTLYGFRTSGTTFTASGLSDGLLNVNASAGNLHANATIGNYAFPTVGFALAPDNATGGNVQLFSPLPVAALTYSFNSQVSLAAGKFAALLGQEAPFTYENVDIQRGLAWNMEPTISRGAQLSYTNGPWSVTLQDNDAYYSGTNRAFEGLVAWLPSSTTSLQFAAIIPGANVPGNPTVVVGNQAEYDLMYTQTIGKLQLFPYFLWAHSPDANPNADLVGFGSGSSANSQTVTPAYHFGNGGVLRLEYSHVSATGFDQSRYGLEFGVMH